jgi:protoheme IX farnesyltransferase
LATDTFNSGSGNWTVPTGVTSVQIQIWGGGGVIDTGAVLLFIILALWQMPHSFAIALYRVDDYTRAHIPVLPVVRGVKQTKIQILIYTVLFVFATLMLYVFGYTDMLYFSVMIILGAIWIWIAVMGLRKESNEITKWAKRLFGFSIITLLVWCLVIVVEHFIV